MNNHYKNFNTYVNGLKKWIDVLNSQNDYIMRLFIDRNIFDDPHIMKIIKSCNKIEYVVFEFSSISPAPNSTVLSLLFLNDLLRISSITPSSPFRECILNLNL